MSGEAHNRGPERTRRNFLETTTALAGAAVVGSVGPAQPRPTSVIPKRGGTLQFGTRERYDRASIRTATSSISSPTPLAAITGGLVDFDDKMEEAKPGIARSHGTIVPRPSKPGPSGSGAAPSTTTARPSTPKSVKWNIERIKDLKDRSRFHALGCCPTWSASRSTTSIPCASISRSRTQALRLNLIYYPVNLMAPGAVDQADTQPVNCGQFKFKSWQPPRHKTEMVRFENFWETETPRATRCPISTRLTGLPKKEDRVRLTALRTRRARSDR